MTQDPNDNRNPLDKFFDTAEGFLGTVDKVISPVPSSSEYDTWLAQLRTELFAAMKTLKGHHLGDFRKLIREVFENMPREDVDFTRPKKLLDV